MRKYELWRKQHPDIYLIGVRILFQLIFIIFCKYKNIVMTFAVYFVIMILNLQKY